MKKEGINHSIRIAAFLLIIIGIFVFLTKVLYEKCYFSIHLNSPETENWRAFYEEPKDSIDVIFLGSSHVYNDFSPAVFYEETGLTSFNMASSNQDVFMSYTYLKAALERQKPKYVFLETSRFCKGVFATANYYYMSFDAMKWSKAKIEGLKTWQKTCPEEKMLDRVFTLITYHTRYEELSRVDFARQEDYYTTQNGYIPSATIKPVNKSEYDIYDSVWEIPPQTEQYIDEIQKLCLEQGIELIFILNPDSEARYGITYSINEAAAARDILFLDYNETERFNSIGLDCDRDFKDAGHLNLFGAEKFTKTLAKDLKEIGVISSSGPDSAKWEKEEKEWERAKALAQLKTCDDIYEYIELLNQFPEYTYFIAASGNAATGIDDSLENSLSTVGFSYTREDLNEASAFSYKGKKKTASSCKKEVISENGKLANGQFWAVTSVGKAALNEEENSIRAVIRIAGNEYSVERDGLLFVVYDEKTENIVDRVCFATNLQTLDAIRE